MFSKNKALEVDVARLQERDIASEKALKLQGKEYQRRLHDLNGEYTRDRERQKDYITVEKYEDKIASMDEARMTAVEAEKDARETALLRMDEKFNDYVKRWEQRARETEQTIQTLTTAAREAKSIAENQGRQTRDEAAQAARAQKDLQAEVQRRQTRSVTVLGIILAAIVGLANLLPLLLH